MVDTSSKRLLMGCRLLPANRVAGDDHPAASCENCAGMAEIEEGERNDEQRQQRFPDHPSLDRA